MSRLVNVKTKLYTIEKMYKRFGRRPESKTDEYPLNSYNLFL